MQAERRRWHGPQPAILPEKDRAVRVMWDSQLHFISLCHENIIYNRSILACHALPVLFPVVVFPGQAVSQISTEGSASDITLTAKPPSPPLPSPLRWKVSFCHSSCQVRSWKTLISLAPETVPELWYPLPMPRNKIWCGLGVRRSTRRQH